MEERVRLAKAKQIDNRTPKTVVVSKLFPAMIALVALCAHVVAQENSEKSMNISHEQFIAKSQEQYIAQYQQIIQAYDEDLQMNPGNASAWIGKGDALKFLIRTNKSLEAYQKALDASNEILEKDSQNIKAWQNRGIAMVNLGREDKAIESYEKTIEILNGSIEKNPNDTDAWWLKAEALDMLGRKEAAIQAYDKVIELNYTKAASAWVRKSDILMQLGKYNESVQALDGAIKIISNGSGITTRSVSDVDKGSSTATDIWSYKDKILCISIGKYNKSSKAYDHTERIYSTFITRHTLPPFRRISTAWD